MKINDIEYRIIRSARKTLAIEVGRTAEVTVRAPKRVSDREIEAFLQRKYVWLKKAITKQQNRGDLFNVSPEELEQLLCAAKAVIPPKVAHFSRLMELTPTAVKINTARTRFGSCSGKNSLNFSAYLMRFPEEAIDYVVVHELAHIKHHNHGKEFYRLIEAYLPDYKERAALLKQTC